MLYVSGNFEEERRVIRLTAEDSMEGQEDSLPEFPVLLEQVTKDSLPQNGSGTAEEPYIYYVKRGGEVKAEVLARLIRLEKCASFIVAEDTAHLEEPLFVWKFDGKVYEEQIEGELESSETESSEAESSDNTEPTETTDSTEPSDEPERSSESSGETPESSSETPEQSSSVPSEEEMPSVPEFEGEFGSEELEAAIGNLDHETQGHTKEELAAMIKQRLLEYENLELAIQRKEKQAEDLKKEIEACTVCADGPGLVSEVMKLEEAIENGQQVFKVQGDLGCQISGSLNEFLALMLKPGEKLSVSADMAGKKTSIEGTLQFIEREPTEGAVPGDMENRAMSYYGFSVSVAKWTGIRPGDSVEVIVPREDKNAEQGDGSIVLPDELLFYESGMAYVYAMGEDGTIEKRPVETGRSILGTETEIISGITLEDYLAYPKDAVDKEGVKAKVVYGEEMEIGAPEEEEE